MARRVSSYSPALRMPNVGLVLSGAVLVVVGGCGRCVGLAPAAATPVAQVVSAATPVSAAAPDSPPAMRVALGTVEPAGDEMAGAVYIDNNGARDLEVRKLQASHDLDSVEVAFAGPATTNRARRVSVKPPVQGVDAIVIPPGATGMWRYKMPAPCAPSFVMSFDFEWRTTGATWAPFALFSELAPGKACGSAAAPGSNQAPNAGAPARTGKP